MTTQPTKRIRCVISQATVTPPLIGEHLDISVFHLHSVGVTA